MSSLRSSVAAHASAALVTALLFLLRIVGWLAQLWTGLAIAYDARRQVAASAHVAPVIPLVVQLPEPGAAAA